MIDVGEAYDILFANVQPGDTIVAPLDQALFRTLAAPVRCDVDYPPFDRSVMDGYAVRAEDVSVAPVRLKVIGQVPAGSVSDKVLGPGEAMQINTGAPIPAGADAVVRVEKTETAETAEEVLVTEAVPAGQFITPRGTYVSAGQTILEAGTRLTPAEIGAAASAGAGQVTVYRRPSVAVLGTGDELVEIEQRPTGAQIRNSNQHLLAALIDSAHAEQVVLGAAPDNREIIRERILEGLRCDVLCITGGVSVGAFDFVPEVLEQLGASLHIRKMRIKPGRPTIFATMPDATLIFALPGNPGGAFVGFELLVRPALAALEGRPGELPLMISATLRGSVSATRDRRTYVPARGDVDEDGGWVAEPLSWHGSGDSFGLSRANALIMRGPAASAVATGDTVSIILLDRR